MRLDYDPCFNRDITLNHHIDVDYCGRCDRYVSSNIDPIRINDAHPLAHQRLGLPPLGFANPWLYAVAAKHPETMLVNELFIGDHGKIRQTCEQIGRHRTGGFQQHLCYMTFTEQCSYKRGRRSKRPPPS